MIAINQHDYLPYLDKLVEWVVESLIKINSTKCNAMSVWYQRRSENVNIAYTMNGCI